MKSASMTDHHHDALSLEGVLTAREVARLESRYRARFESDEPPESIDLSRVESGDSSALALLLEWQSRAGRSGRQIRFEKPPESLRVIARLTGVSPLLGWTEANGDDATNAKDGS